MKIGPGKYKRLCRKIWKDELGNMKKTSREMKKMQGNHFVSPSQHVVSLLWRLTDRGRTFKFVADITMISIISIVNEHLASTSASSTVKTFSSLHSHYHHHRQRHCYHDI